MADAEGERSEGSAERLRVISASSASGTSGRAARTSGAGPSVLRTMMACADGPVYGASPASIS